MNQPHWTILIVNIAIWGPTLRTNVCKPEPAFQILNPFKNELLAPDKQNKL
jgi:hypothetical protein